MATTLENALNAMLKKAVVADRLRHINPGSSDLFAYDTLADPVTERLVTSLGTDAINLENLRFVTVSNGTHPYLVADLRVPRDMPRPLYEAFLKRLFTDNVYHEIEADPANVHLANALDIGGPNPAVNISNPNRLNALTDLENLPQVERSYVVPIDPQLLLLALSHEDRPLLSRALELAKNDRMPPYTNVDGRYHDATIANYGFSREAVQQVVGNGLVTPTHVVAAATELGGGANPLHYITRVSQLKERLRNLPVNPRP